MTKPSQARRITAIVRTSSIAWVLPALVVACATPRGPGSGPAAAPIGGPSPAPASLLQEDPFDARYKVQCDAASGKTVCVMTGNALRPFIPRYPLLSLGAISEVGGSGPPRYFLRAVYVGEAQWLTVGEGGTLRLTIDGETLALSGTGSAGSRYTGEAGKVYEVALYPASAELIKRIASAKTVAVSIQGDFLLEKNFGSFNNLYFRQFFQHYIEKTRGAAE